MSAQFIEAVESLLQFFGDLHVDFKGSYRTRLPSRKLECVAKYLDHAGGVFQADALREAYEWVRKKFYAKPVDPDSFPLTDVEERRLAVMNDEDRRLARQYLRRAGSEEQLRQDLQAAAGRMVELLQEVKRNATGRGDAILVEVERIEAQAAPPGRLRRPPKPWNPTKATRKVIKLMNEGLSNEALQQRTDLKVKNTAENIRQIRHRAIENGLLPPDKADET